MTRPETCGAAGGAISVWVHYASGSGTIIATISSFIETGFQIYCSNDVLQYEKNSTFLLSTNPIKFSARARLYQASASTPRPLCDDASDSVLTEIKGDK